MRVAGVNGDDKCESDHSGQQAGDQEVGDGAHSDHAVHLGVEARGSSDERGNDQWENHALEKSHEEFSRISKEMNHVIRQVKRTEDQTINSLTEAVSSLKREFLFYSDM